MLLPKAFIFDLDGVITDTAECHFMAWRILGEALGIDFDRSFNETLKGVSRMGSLERILTYGNKADVYTNEEKVRLANEKNKAYVDLVSKITKEDVLPNILSLLQSLRNKNIKIGLASASENAFEVIDRLGIRHYFDYIADATKIPNSKPAPDVFLDVMHGFGFESTECIGIEDAQAGIEAIKAANMFAVGIGKKSELIGADIIFENTEKMTFDLVVNQWLKGQN